MWAYDDDLGRGRRARDLPRSSAAGPSRYYYDDPPYSSSSPRYQQPDSQPAASSSHRSRRRTSVPPADLPEPTSKSSSSRRANVVASDDGSDFYRRSTRDPFAYPERSSRHDVEAKTSDRSRKFREKRGTYDTDESENWRRAKSHSPRRAAARDVDASRNPSPPTAKSAWADNPADAYGRTASSTKKSYDPYAAEYAKYKDYTAAAPPEDKSSKHARRAKYCADDDYAAAGYDDRPPRHRSSKPRDDPVDPYGTQSHRGRYRGGGPDEYDDPYASRSAPPPRAKHRQSLPPRTRSRYDGYDEGPEGRRDYGDDSYYNQPAPSRRRAASGSDPGRVRRERPQQYYGDDRYEARGSPGAGGSPSGAPPPARTSSRKEKSKQWQKQAGNLFMTHAVPVLKKEAVPLLTKAAQAYFENSKR